MSPQDVERAPMDPTVKKDANVPMEANVTSGLDLVSANQDTWGPPVSPVRALYLII